MPDIYLARLIRMIEDEVNHPRYMGYCKPCDTDIDSLLNSICVDLDLSLRFHRVDSDLLKINFDNNGGDEFLLFPEVVARFRESYPLLLGECL